MADPISMAIIAAGSMAVGKIIEGQAAGSAADANARIAGQNRDIAIQQGDARELAQRRESARFLGEQTASIAQAGVDPSSGSALRVQEESAVRAELDALNIRYGARMQAFGFEREAALERARGKQARRSGYLSAVTTMLGGASQAYGMRPGGGG